MEREVKLLLLFLRENLVLRYANGPLKESLRVFAKEYLAQTRYGGSTGHYDWLRSPTSELQGVRYWPFDDNEDSAVTRQLLLACRGIRYARIQSNKYVELLFTPRPNVNEEESQDQELSDNGIYRSNSHDFLLYFDISDLTPTELASLSPLAKPFTEGEM